MELDVIDRKILARLMADATVPVARLAAEVGLSQTPCWKRVQKLKAAGVIRGQVAVVDPERLGFALTVFATVEAPEASADWQARFAAVVAGVPLVGSEVLRGRRRSPQPLSFATEWALVALLVGAMSLADWVLLTVTLASHAPLLHMLTATAVTIAAYPLPALVLRLAGIRRLDYPQGVIRRTRS
ncbi:Lrp/AsnC family transcriptional regulator [Mangrovicoccus ximenensis]|uniref:Lrp/AsnC family transcriptional regulator n=1 Tax=Mangrovicoccus ximenensis TaxID=1911570 RepID=UPI000D39ED16|nr:Lrp/AsnC family transcriptional regulator [Mangrovicoccus ximenensis]